jgi:siroheme synthase-like protein
VSARYPVLLDVSRLRVLVVGGGAVALRKVRALVDAGALPEIVSPEIHPELEALVRAHALLWQARRYESSDVFDMSLVFAATSSAEVNAAVARDADENHTPVNVADDGEGSTFHVPSSIHRDEVVVAVSTGGASPLLARRLRERLEAVVTPGLGRAARRLARARAEVRARWPADEGRRREAWFALVTPDFMDAAIAGRDDEVEHRITACLSQS